MPDMILIRESIQKDLKMIVSKKSPNQLRLVPTQLGIYVFRERDIGSKLGSNSQIGGRRELYFSCISEGKYLMVLSYSNCRSSVTPLEPVSCMSRILMMMTMMRSSQIPSSNKVSCLMWNEMASAINVINVFLLSPRE